MLFLVRTTRLETQNEEKGQQITRLETENEKLKEQITRLETQNEEQGQQITRFETENEQTKTQITQLINSLNENTDIQQSQGQNIAGVLTVVVQFILFVLRFWLN